MRVSPSAQPDDGPLELVSAGAVVLAGPPEQPLVALIHRRSPAEWRLPKGKLKPGETPRQAAEREVLEETGLVITAGEEVGSSAYSYGPPAGRPVRKRVHFYLARVPEPLPLQPELRSFDAARWVPVAEALEILAWENEREVVREAARP